MRKLWIVWCGLLISAATGVYAQSSVIEDSSRIDISDNETGKLVRISKITSTDGEAPSLPQNSDKKENKLSPEELCRKADAGDVNAQLDAGYMYLYGVDGEKVDYGKALHYYTLAAQQKNAAALNNLGSLYFNGLGTPINYKKAIQYFDEATQLGSNDAAVNLAIIYMGSNPETKTQADFQKIYDLLKQAETTNKTAKFLVGYSYYQGFLVKQDYKKAFLLIKAVADAQYDEAQYVLADFYINGFGAPKSYARAVEYLEKAAAQGNSAAIMKLAGILEEGEIYPKDTKRAYVLYNTAATLGEDSADGKRDEIEKSLSLNDLLAAQQEAEKYVSTPSDLTAFIRKTFGNSLKIYVDINMDADFDIIAD